MSVSGKYITYGEGENSTTVTTEHKSKLCAPGDIIQASRHQHRTVLQDLSVNTCLPPVHHEKVMSPILSVSHMIFNMVKKNCLICLMFI